MSIVIPASQLQHTIVTIRCESDRTVPQIECSFDEDAPPGLSSHSDRGASFTFSDRKSPSNSPGLPPPLNLADQASSGTMMPRADLSIERGVDSRGHFVRMSFSPAQNSTSPTNAGEGVTAPAGLSSLNLASLNRRGTPRQSTPRTTSPRQSTPHNSSNFILTGSHDLMVSPDQMSMDPFSQIMPETPMDFENMAFPLAADAELMSALETSLSGLDYAQNGMDYFSFMSSAGDACNSNQFFDPAMPPQFQADNSIPPTPGLTSAASSCASDFSSPGPSFDFSSTATSRRTSHESIAGLNTGLMSMSDPPVPSPMIPAGGYAPGFDAQFASAIQSMHQQQEQHGQGPHSESRLLPCPHMGCKRQFKNTSTLTGHLKTHAGKGSRFTCTFPPCSEKFSRRHDQLRHEVYKHGKRCEWVCQRCGSFFSYERSLEKHVCTMDKSRRGTAPPYQVAPKVEQAADH